MLLAFPTSIYLFKIIIKDRRALREICVKLCKTKNKFGKSNCVNLSSYKWGYFLLFWLLSTIWIYHFHCFSLISVRNRCLHHLRYHQRYHQELFILNCLKLIICEVWANNYEWMKCYLRFIWKGDITYTKL